MLNVVTHRTGESMVFDIRREFAICGHSISASEIGNLDATDLIPTGSHYRLEDQFGWLPAVTINLRSMS